MSKRALELVRWRAGVPGLQCLKVSAQDVKGLGARSHLICKSYVCSVRCML